MHTHKLLLTIEYVTENPEPQLCALAVERALLAHYGVFKDVKAKLEYAELPVEDILS